MTDTKLQVFKTGKQLWNSELLNNLTRIPSYDLEQNSFSHFRFDIRLMKEGRMKGQAFITLPSEDKAKKALRDVHGYILQGKPMVIVSLNIFYLLHKFRGDVEC